MTILWILLSQKLERQLKCQLECPRSTRPEDTARRGDRFAERRRDRWIVPVRDERIGEARVIGIRNAKNVGLVRQVKNFANGLQRESLGQAKVLRDSQVQRIERIAEPRAGRQEGQWLPIDSSAGVQLCDKCIQLRRAVELPSPCVPS